MSRPRPAWLPPLNSHENYSINLGIHQLDSRECLPPPSTEPHNLKSIQIFFYVDVKFYDINNPHRTPIDALSVCQGIKIHRFLPHPSHTIIKNRVLIGILRNRQLVPFQIDRIHRYRETDRLEPMYDRSYDNKLHTDEDLASRVADFVLLTMKKYAEAGGQELEISLRLEKLVTIPNQEFESWMSWFDEQKRVNPDSFENEYLEAISVPRTLHELWYESSLRNCKSATESCIKSLEKLELEQVDDDSGRSSCTICMEELQEGEQLTKLPCSHLFHRDCIVQWLKMSNFCPICRFTMPTA